MVKDVSLMADGVSHDLYMHRPDLYDVMHADHKEDGRFLAEFIESFHTVPRVLELGCGTGRLLKPMLDAGAEVTGLDSTPAMLRYAQNKLAMYGEKAHYVEGDMRDFSLEKQFDLVVIGLNTFMHLTTQRDQLACLTAAHRHLRPAGRILIDLANPHTVLHETPTGVLTHRFTKKIEEKSACTVTLWSCTAMHLADQLVHTTLFFDEMQSSDHAIKRLITEVWLRLTYRFELELLLARAGFGVQRIQGGYDAEPYDEGSDRLIAIAAALA